jgi:hypothetical protein
MRIKPKKTSHREKNKMIKLKRLIASNGRKRHIKRMAGGLMRYPAFRHQVAVFQGLVGMAEAIKDFITPKPPTTDAAKEQFKKAVDGFVKEGEKTAKQVKAFRSSSIFGDMGAFFFRGMKKDETK